MGLGLEPHVVRVRAYRARRQYSRKRASPVA